ncbi:MAG: hypothetical protein ACU85V_04635 [Gammaproteobacteria bacterium]
MSDALKLALALLASCAAILHAVHRLENPKSQFADFSAMAGAGMIRAGWIPASLPETATDITEQHSMDTNAGFVSFHAPATDIATMASGCRPIRREDLKRVARPPSWWPRELADPKRQAEGLRYFACGKSGVLAVREPGKAFYWYPSRSAATKPEG